MEQMLEKIKHPSVLLLPTNSNNSGDTHVSVAFFIVATERFFDYPVISLLCLCLFLCIIRIREGDYI